MRPARLLTATALAAAATLALTAPVAAGGPQFQDPSQVPPPPPPPVLTVSDATAYEADGTIGFHVELSEPAPAGMMISTSVAHEDTEDADFAPVLVGNIAPGDTEYTVTLGLAIDDGVEDVENFVLHVETNEDHDIVNSAADGFILDGDGPQLEIVDVAETEGDPGDDQHLQVAVQASYAPLSDLTFRLHSGLFGFEAEAGVDFEPIDEIVTLPAGETVVSVPLTIVEDLLDEDDELLPVYGEDPSAGAFTLNGASAILRILDDDEPGDDQPDDDGSAVPDGTDPGDPVPTSTPAGSGSSAATPAGPEVLDVSTGRSTGSLARTGNELSVLWIAGALALAAGILLVVLAGARRSHRRNVRV